MELKYLKLGLLITLSVALCHGAPSRTVRQSPQQTQTDFNPQLQQFGPPPPRQFASPQSQFAGQGRPQQNSPPQAQFIPNGQFFPNQFQQPNGFPNQGVPPQFPQQPQQQFTGPVQSVPSVSQQAGAIQPGAPEIQQPQPESATQSNIVEVTPLPTTLPPHPPTPKIVPPPVDKNVDLDGDGALSLAEVQYAAFVHHGLASSVVENLFNQVDKNKDGYLTSIEFNDLRPLVLAKAENAALRYLNNVDLNHNGLLSLPEAQAYILKEYGISNRDVERIWRLVVPSSSDEMDAVLFSKLRRRVRGMSIRLARQIMKYADQNEDGHIALQEAQQIAFEQEGIGAADVIEMLASVDDNNDGELNAPEFADFERIVRARAVETSRKALRVVDTDGSGTLTMEEARKIAFDHYGFDERTLEPFFAQADENEDAELDAVEFAGFRSVIRSRAVKNAQALLPEVDTDGDGFVSNLEAEEKARREDDMDPKETFNLFSVADQDKNNVLDKVELADFVRLVRLSAIKYATDHFREFDANRDKKVTLEELQTLIEEKYGLDPAITLEFFQKVDVDFSDDLSPGEIVDFRHEVRKFVAERDAREEIQAQHRREMAEIEAKLRKEAEDRLTLIKQGEEKPAAEATQEPSGELFEEDTELEDNEEVTTTTTAAPQIKKKKRVLKKHKDAVTTTTTEAPVEEIVEEVVTETPEEQPAADGKIAKDSTLEEVEDKEADETLDVVTTLEPTTSAPEIVETEAETQTTAVFETTTPVPVSETATEAVNSVTLTKRRKLKKIKASATPEPENEIAVAETIVETVTEPVPDTTTVPEVTEITTIELTTTSTPEPATETMTTITATPEPTTEVTTAVIEPQAATEAVEYEYVDEEEESTTTTTTTAQPKRRRLRKKLRKTTTTTLAPEEYEEVEEEITEPTE